MTQKKATKEIKRLKRKAKKAKSAYKKLEKRARKLKKKLDARKQQVTDLQTRLDHAQTISELQSSSTEEIGGQNATSVAAGHRSAWKQHAYLRDRYEFHLSAGAPKERARHLANEDLKQAYGEDSGYTEDDLGAILS